MKQPKILFLVVIALLPLILVSCAPWGTQSAGGWSGTAFHDGIIYAGTVDGRVVAINASSGVQKWDYQITMLSSGTSCGPSVVSAPIYGTPIVDGDLVYIGTYSGQVYALTIDRGTERWVYPRTGSIGAIVGTPVVVNETIYVSSSDSTVYALDTTYGDLEGEYEILDEKGQRHEKLWTSPVVHDGTVYVSTLDGYIYALSTETGEREWAFKSEAGFASSPVIYEDTMFLGSFDRYLYAIKIGSDVPIWKFPQEKPAGNWFWAPPVINEDIIYAGCLDGKLYAIDAETEKELWQFESQDSRGKPAAIVSPPVLAGDLLIVANEAGNVYVINPETGEGEQIRNPEDDNKPTINAQIRSSFCAHDGVAYIRAEDNKLYVVDIENGEVSWNFDLTKMEE